MKKGSANRAQLLSKQPEMQADRQAKQEEWRMGKGSSGQEELRKASQNKMWIPLSFAQEMPSLPREAQRKYF